MTYNQFVKVLRISMVSVILIALTGVYSYIEITNESTQFRQTLLKNTQLSSLSLNTSKIEKLTGTTADINTDIYNSLITKLNGIKSIVNHSSYVYICRLHDNQIIFLAENSIDLPDNNSFYPGQVYIEYSSKFYQLFDNGNAFVEGPIEDRWGNWISALVPLYGECGKIIGVLGVDISSEYYFKHIILNSLPNILSLVLIIGLIILVFFIVDPIRT